MTHNSINYFPSTTAEHKLILTIRSKVKRDALLLALSVEVGAAPPGEEVIEVAEGGLVLMVAYPAIKFPEATGVAHSSMLKSTHGVIWQHVTRDAKVASPEEASSTTPDLLDIRLLLMFTC